MAIPFALPTDGEADSHQMTLMLDLYAALHRALRSRNAAQHPSRNREFLRSLILTMLQVYEQYERDDALDR